MLTLAMPRKGEETTPGIIAPPIQNQRGNGWFPKQGPQQIVGPPPRGPPPPVIDNWPRPPDVYWNNYPPSVQHLQLPPQQIKKPPVFGAYGVRSNEDYMPPIRGGCVPADYVLPPRGERGYVYNNQIQRPHPSTCDQSAVFFVIIFVQKFLFSSLQLLVVVLDLHENLDHLRLIHVRKCFVLCHLEVNKN